MKKYFALMGLIAAGFLLFVGGTSLTKQSAASGQPAALTATVENNSAAEQTRCGWYSNPTPGNHWLDDRHGQWIIGTQGGHQAEGDYPPPFKRSQWVRTNGNYGYGCACIRGTFDADKKEVKVVTRATARSLAACRRDKTLKEPR